MQYLPIVFVRGYAGTQKDVEQTVNDPFYGFNSGSTHIRVDEKENPQKFFFESPLLRLMTDHGYQPIVDNQNVSNQIKRLSGQLHKTIWIYRFYDISTPSFGSSSVVRQEMEEIAKGLRDLIQNVKETTGADKIYLVGHSMGGLVCRSLIQKIYPDENKQAADHIDKFFTYATPHGGIYFEVGGGLIENLRDKFQLNNSDDFGPQRMYQYLTPEANKPTTELPDDFQLETLQSIDTAFSPSRVFSLIGTNAHDYEEGFGFSRKFVGVKSDGLVQIDKAYILGSHRAYVHRSHGGRYGILNSEEGYQNLQRFLFGDIQVKLSLSNVELEDLDKNFYQLETRVALRGLPIPIYEQAIAHYCPITQELTRTDKPVPLFTAFLIPRNSASDDNTCRYALRLALHSFTKQETNWLRDSHLDQVPLWSDYLITDVAESNSTYEAKYSWNSKEKEPVTKLNPTSESSPGVYVAYISLPERGQKVLGTNAAVRLEISQWK
ncbi:lipase family alpha/beta hydrolase [Nostoc sp. DedQUE09]|uniref:lipase family alpha/beta hydrolase n=1 Tax=Nostoc sp. DedQUE09 TaxID=3075394 RepID=UPI002AD201EA|nr:alpha/beta fold hydrolase [Nostoc sp. DedQUE09]MDZ7952480.1 alpha/beta hydrolase [Nostoc sp. DedQUE09]